MNLLSSIIASIQQIGILYNEAVKTLNSYHSVATAQRMLAKLEKYSVLLIKLQEQAIALKGGFKNPMTFLRLAYSADNSNQLDYLQSQYESYYLESIMAYRFQLLTLPQISPHK